MREVYNQPTAQDHPTTAQTASRLGSLPSRMIGTPCLVPALRDAHMPPDFKGPRKVPNYTVDLEPA